MRRKYQEGVHFTLRIDKDDIKWLFGPASISRKVARWSLRLKEFLFTVEYLAGKKNSASDRISHLDTSGSEKIKKHIDAAEPVLAIEDGANPPVLDVHKMAIPDTDKEDHSKPAKTVSPDEMLAAQREYFECQQYAATIGLPS